MGGDGGTLNNSRHEHTRLRAAVLGLPDASSAAARLRQTSSVTHCALTKEVLQPPHVVTDRLGQLFNKESLLRHILHRHSAPSPVAEDVFAHIRSIKKDTAAVQLSTACPLTQRALTADGRFALCWTCGRISAAIIPGIASLTTCPFCSAKGQRVLLGMTLQQRLSIQRAIVAERQMKKLRTISKNSVAIKKKRRPKPSAAVDSDVQPSAHTTESEFTTCADHTEQPSQQQQASMQPPANTSSAPTPG